MTSSAGQGASGGAPQGLCPARFAAVAEAIGQSVEDGEETGLGFAVWIDGDPAIDLVAGFADKARQTPWTPETLVCVYSSGKAVVAMLVARGVSAGALDYDRPAADYWPDFAAEGKDRIALGDVLAHRAGVPGIAEPMEPADWLDRSRIGPRIAALSPFWPPGTAHGYHPQTVGVIANEVLNRSVGATVGAMLRKTKADVHCGLAPEDMARTAYMPKPPRAPDLGPVNPYKEAAFLKPWSAPARVAREDWMAAELPASNMHATAGGLARLLQPLACGGDGDPAFDPAVIEAAFAPRSRGPDLVLPFDLTWAAGLLHNTNGQFGPEPRALGHAGFGGSCVVIDPVRRMTVAYTPARMSPSLMGDPRALRLLDALYSAL